jgi:CBS domain-containing membrane protein
MTSELITLFEQQTLPIADDIMKFRRIRHLPVVDDEGRLVGLITHRDVLRAQVSYVSFVKNGQEGDRGAVDLDIQVKDVMSRDVWTVSPTTPAHEAGQLLADHAFSCLPVIEPGRRLVGILTDRDFLKFALEVLERFDR